MIMHDYTSTKNMITTIYSLLNHEKIILNKKNLINNSILIGFEWANRIHFAKVPVCRHLWKVVSDDTQKFWKRKKLYKGLAIV